MRKIAVLGFLAAIALPAVAFAQEPTGYGTEGPDGQRLTSGALTTYQRNWNAAHEAENRARTSAELLRQRGAGLPSPF